MKLLLIIIIVFFAASKVSYAEDFDQDGVDDQLERTLLADFSPIIVTDQPFAEHQTGVGIPVSVTWFLGHVRVVPLDDEDGTLLDRPTPQELLDFIKTVCCHENLKMPFSIQDVDGDGNYGEPEDDAKWGNSPIEPTSWQHAIANGRGVYGRVFKPWPIEFPNLHSVQYYMLLTWNDTDAPLNTGNHDGDWICMDYCVDIDAPGGPEIIHAIYHNHGKQMYLTRESLSFSGKRAYVFLELGTNEPWPNAAGDGTGGWPTSRGFAKNAMIESPVGEVYRSHQGNGLIYDLASIAEIPNIGESYDWSDTVQVFSLCGIEGEVIHRYRGHWGWLYECNFGVCGDPPRSPVYQQFPSYPSKMWGRRPAVGGDGSGGLWIADIALEAVNGNPPAKWGLHPFFNDIYDMGLYIRGKDGTVTQLKFPTEAPLIVRSQFVPTAYVSTNAVGPFLGLSVNPYGYFGDALEFGSPHGGIIVEVGSYPGSFQISKPTRIIANGGPVTIGQ